jgi:hypothetical protein
MAAVIEFLCPPSNLTTLSNPANLIKKINLKLWVQKKRYFFLPLSRKPAKRYRYQTAKNKLNAQRPGPIC